MTALVTVELDGYGACAWYTSGDFLIFDSERSVVDHSSTKLCQLSAGILATGPRSFADTAYDPGKGDE